MRDKGSYHTFSESYETVLRYIEENGYEVAGEIRESYIDGVWNKDDESEWLSEIQVPVRRKRNHLCGETQDAVTWGDPGRRGESRRCPAVHTYGGAV